ncbi:hypothetical protein T05_4304 [Trichinella murrelli]|uniref:Uncharacterized protein n=1 Tax=Trichinella murrelli TaxID=144512 RepID=A0A0V0UG26_9BILA|nr:hypothetical protein T05_4304 [Trichinella murrelli]
MSEQWIEVPTNQEEFGTSCGNESRHSHLSLTRKCCAVDARCLRHLMRRRRPLGQWLFWIEKLEVLLWITLDQACIQVHMEDNDMIDVYVFGDASEKA